MKLFRRINNKPISLKKIMTDTSKAIEGKQACDQKFAALIPRLAGQI